MCSQNQNQFRKQNNAILTKCQRVSHLVDADACDIVPSLLEQVKQSHSFYKIYKLYIYIFFFKHSVNTDVLKWSMVPQGFSPQHLVSHV